MIGRKVYLSRIVSEMDVLARPFPNGAGSKGLKPRGLPRNDSSQNMFCDESSPELALGFNTFHCRLPIIDVLLMQCQRNFRSGKKISHANTAALS